MTTNKDIARLFAQGIENASNPSGSLYIEDGAGTCAVMGLVVKHEEL